jgi:hypothetical protein
MYLDNAQSNCSSLLPPWFRLVIKLSWVHLCESSKTFLVCQTNVRDMWLFWSCHSSGFRRDLGSKMRISFRTPPRPSNLCLLFFSVFTFSVIGVLLSSYSCKNSIANNCFGVTRKFIHWLWYQTHCYQNFVHHASVLIILHAYFAFSVTCLTVRCENWFHCMSNCNTGIVICL